MEAVPFLDKAGSEFMRMLKANHDVQELGKGFDRDPDAIGHMANKVLRWVEWNAFVKEAAEADDDEAFRLATARQADTLFEKWSAGAGG